MMESTVDFCPVPLEQQPIHEYEQLKDSWFFHWVTLEPLIYTRKLMWVSLWGWLFASPIAAASFPPQKQLLDFVLGGVIGSIFFVGLVLIRLYLGWRYIRDRLQKKTVVYEESGWYDGQVWEKPETILNRDRLIASYQVEPILKRLQKTALILICSVTIGSLLWML
jgi:hypothetical protein